MNGSRCRTRDSASRCVRQTLKLRCRTWRGAPCPASSKAKRRRRVRFSRAPPIYWRKSRDGQRDSPLHPRARTSSGLETPGTPHLQNLTAGLARADLLVQFSESPENQFNVLATIQNGMTYFPVGLTGFSGADEPIVLGGSVSGPNATRYQSVPYVARNGMTVTITAFSGTDLGNGYMRYVVSYRQQNNTTTAIDEGFLKLYFGNATAMPEYGFFNAVLPGANFALDRSYTFDAPAANKPSVLEYDADNFFSTSPGSNTLQWGMPVPTK